MRIPFILLLLSLGLPPPALAENRHVITFRSRNLSPSTLRWDPSAQHFLVGSLRRPTITSISDAGIVDTIVSDDDRLPGNSSFPSIAVDAVRRRLLAVVSAPSSPPHLAAYDLRSPRPHRRIFLSPLSSDASDNPAGLAVDPARGEAYVTSSASNLIWKVDLEGSPSVLSRCRIDGQEVTGLAGIAYNGKGYLLVVQTSSGRVLKVDPEGGTARLVLMRKPIVGAEGIEMRADGAAVAFSGETAWVLMSEDGWGEAAVYDEIAGKRRRPVRGVAVREGRRVYLLYGEEVEGHSEESEGRLGRGEGEGILGIEEVEFDREVEGECVWALVLVGLGLAYFTYWRMQMGKLVSNMNKKKA